VPLGLRPSHPRSEDGQRQQDDVAGGRYPGEPRDREGGPADEGTRADPRAAAPERPTDDLGRAEEPEQGADRGERDVTPATGLPLVDAEPDGKAGQDRGNPRGGEGETHGGPPRSP